MWSFKLRKDVLHDPVPQTPVSYDDNVMGLSLTLLCIFKNTKYQGTLNVGDRNSGFTSEAR